MQKRLHNNDTTVIVLVAICPSHSYLRLEHQLPAASPQRPPRYLAPIIASPIEQAVALVHA